MNNIKPLLPSNVEDTDRIWRTEIAGYDQVISLTQHMINQGIQNFYLYLDVNGKLPKPVTRKSDPSSLQKLYKVTFEPPVVVVASNPSNYTSVLLTVTLKTGIAKLVQGYDDGDSGDSGDSNRLEMASLNMKGVSVTMPANVESLKLDPDTDRGKEMRKRMRAGDHSIYQLLVDLASAAWGDGKWDYGTWTKDDWVTTTIDDEEEEERTRPQSWKLGKPRDIDVLGQGFKQTFETFFALLARKVIMAGMLTMGYTKRYDQPTEKPTFEVNNVRYQTYPWTEPDGKGVTPGRNGKSRLNYLCYLESVGQNSPPDANDPSASILTAAGNGRRRGNWTDGTDPNKDDPTTFGNFVLSHKSFMENYFIPKLENINRLMKCEITWIDIKIDVWLFGFRALTNFETQVGKDYNGTNEKSSEEYRFKRENFSIPSSYDQGAKAWFKDWVDDVPKNAIQWNWSSARSRGIAYRYQHTGSVKEWAYKQYYNHTRIFVVPGSNKIFVHGGVWMKLDFEIKPSFISSTQYGEFGLFAQWSAVFTMRELDKGGLYLDVDFSGVKVEEAPGNKEWGGTQWTGGGARDQFKKASKNFEYVINGLRDSLAHQDKFVMPSSGVYFFKNPVFDHHANLICQLEYDGTFEEGVEPTNKSGITDPGISRPAFQDFPREMKAESSRGFVKKDNPKDDGSGEPEYEPGTAEPDE